MAKTQNPWFGEKTRQVNTHSLTAFGIDLTSRYAQAMELSELLAFAATVASFDCHHLLKSADYDSKACLCTFEFTCEFDKYGTEAALIEQAAKETISQYELFGSIGHGGASRDLDLDS